MSLDIKQVIQIARVQFKELLPDLAINIPAPPAPRKGEPSPRTKKDILENDIRLEELEKEGENWAVTFSVPNPNYSPDALLAGIRSARNLARIAKVVVIDGSEGKLVALRERAA
ncbi:MAG: hypothetical protein ABR912_15315 [Terracidiphilus sp.]|jgi:hypothetical protein